MSLKETVRALAEMHRLPLGAESRKSAWIAAVADVFASIRDWTADLARENLLSYGQSSVERTEDSVGSYRIDVLTLRFPDHREIEIQPAGIDVVGANGRIDFFRKGYFDLGKMIVRDAAGEWHILDRRAGVKSIPFDRTNFERSLEAVLTDDGRKNAVA